MHLIVLKLHKLACADLRDRVKIGPTVFRFSKAKGIEWYFMDFELLSVSIRDFKISSL